MDRPLQEAAMLDEWSRTTRMRAALLAYNDQLPKPLRITPSGPDDNVQTNYIEPIVDRIVSFLVGDGPSIEIGGPDDATGEAYLDRVWPADERFIFLDDAAINGALFGHVFARLAIENGIPRVVLLDPMGMTVEWDPTDWTRVTRFIYQWSAADVTGQARAFREVVERKEVGWIISTQEVVGGAWSEMARVEWRYTTPPIVHCKNRSKPNEFWGQPDITRGVLRLNHYINRIDSLINRIIRLHGYPKTVARGVAKSDLQLGVDGIIFLPEVEQTIENIEMQSDLGAALNFRDRLLQLLSRISGVPDLGNDESVGTQVSGVALKMKYKTLLDRTRRKRVFYGALLRQIVVGMLEIGGLARLARPEAVAIHWPDPLPANDREVVDIALLKQQLGFSRDTLIRQLGGDPDLEAEKRRAEAEEAARDFAAGRIG